MITAQVESWSACLPELVEIFPEHYASLALNRDKVPLAPRFDVYARMEADGSLFVVTLRELGKLVGYFVGFVTPSLHYSTCLECKTDIFWVRPEFRTGGRNAGKQLFRAVERELKRRGVQRWFVGTKLHQDASALFSVLGFEPVEVYHSKWIGD